MHVGIAVGTLRGNRYWLVARLPPGVNSDGLSEKQIARGNFYLRPNDRYTKRQQDLLDMDEDNGSEDSWTYCKDESSS